MLTKICWRCKKAMKAKVVIAGNDVFVKRTCPCGAIHITSFGKRK